MIIKLEIDTEKYPLINEQIKEVERHKIITGFCEEVVHEYLRDAEMLVKGYVINETIS